MIGESQRSMAQVGFSDFVTGPRGCTPVQVSRRTKTYRDECMCIVYAYMYTRTDTYTFLLLFLCLEGGYLWEMRTALRPPQDRALTSHALAERSEDLGGSLWI